MLHKEVVTKETFDLIQTLMKDTELKDFVLGGDTVLCLQLGHRKSDGIELFTVKTFDAERLARHMKETYDAEIRKVYVGSIRCFIRDISVELSFYGHIQVIPRHDSRK